VGEMLQRGDVQKQKLDAANSGKFTSEVPSFKKL
jgi:hypothetical protein